MATYLIEDRDVLGAVEAADPDAALAAGRERWTVGKWAEAREVSARVGSAISAALAAHPIADRNAISTNELMATERARIVTAMTDLGADERQTQRALTGYSPMDGAPWDLAVERAAAKL